MASFEERAQLYKNESESFQEYLINLPAEDWKKQSACDDVGMGAATTTIHRQNCKEISDVVTTKEPWLATDNDWVPTDYHCNRSENHLVELWVGPSECPKYSTTMEVDLTVDILWD